MIEMWADGMVHLCLQADGTDHAAKMQHGHNDLSIMYTKWLELYHLMQLTN